MLSKRLVGLVILVGLALGFAGLAEAGWYNPSWDYRRPITLDPVTPEANYQVKVTLTSVTLTGAQLTSGNANGNDIIFTGSNGTTPQDYWIESWSAAGTAVTATIWVEVAASGTSQIYMYYGNPSAASASDSSIIYISSLYRSTYWNDVAWHDITTDSGNVPTNLPIPTFTVPNNWNKGHIGATITAGDTRLVSLGYSINSGGVILIGSQSAVSPGTYLSVSNLVLNAGNVIHWWAKTDSGGGWWMMNDVGFTTPTTIRQYVSPEPTATVGAEERYVRGGVGIGAPFIF